MKLDRGVHEKDRLITIYEFPDGAILFMTNLDQASSVRQAMLPKHISLGYQCRRQLFGAQRTGSIAVLQLLYTEATAAERLFPQEKTTLHDLKRATSIGELH